MCHHALRTPFELDDVTDMVGKIFAGPVTFHDGTSELAPNLTIHKVGGHSKGLQIVRIMTRRGWVVLGSDASHFYANFEQGRPFPVLESVSEMLEGFDTMRRLASSNAHVHPPRWLRGLLARAHSNTVVVALAAKMARIVWALLRYGTRFEPRAIAG